MTERSRGQQRAIRNYYDNRQSIAWQRAQELVGDLYLAEGKKRQRAWQHLRGHLAALDVPGDTLDHLQSQDDPQLVAQLLQRLEAKHC